MHLFPYRLQQLKQDRRVTRAKQDHVQLLRLRTTAMRLAHRARDRMSQQQFKTCWTLVRMFRHDRLRDEQASREGGSTAIVQAGQVVRVYAEKKEDQHGQVQQRDFPEAVSLPRLPAQPSPLRSCEPQSRGRCTQLACLTSAEVLGGQQAALQPYSGAAPGPHPP